MLKFVFTFMFIRSMIVSMGGMHGKHFRWVSSSGILWYPLVSCFLQLRPFHPAQIPSCDHWSQCQTGF